MAKLETWEDGYVGTSQQQSQKKNRTLISIYQSDPGLQKEFPDMTGKGISGNWTLNDWWNRYGAIDYPDVNLIQPGEETQEDIDQQYAEVVSENPVIKELAQGGSSVEEIMNAMQTGNWEGIVDWNGQPFSAQDQQTALAQAQEDNRLYYEALQAKETANTEAALAQDQADYQNYLLNAGQSFEADKATSDEKAASSGVLFSGGRAHKEKNLQRAYTQDQEYNRDKLGRSMGTTANNFQYKYGNDAAKGLSNYYNIGGNTYNPNVARNGVGSSGLSSIYNPDKYNFQGTVNTERLANANTRAAGYLKNKGNKLLGTGYQNQL